LEEKFDEVITTIYFDGQFWAALVEKIAPDGQVRVGRHVFGSEPDNGEILRFYRDVYDDLPLRRTEGRFRLKRDRSREEQERCFSKSLRLYSESRTEYLRERKSLVKERKERDREEEFRHRREKRKERRKH